MPSQYVAASRAGDPTTALLPWPATTVQEWEAAERIVADWQATYEADCRRGREILRNLQPATPTGAMAIACPRCDAAPGWWCSRGDAAILTQLHAARRAAAGEP